jgi:hypothetical protein
VADVHGKAQQPGQQQQPEDEAKDQHLPGRRQFGQAARRVGLASKLTTS